MISLGVLSLLQPLIEDEKNKEFVFLQNNVLNFLGMLSFTESEFLDEYVSESLIAAVMNSLVSKEIPLIEQVTNSQKGHHPCQASEKLINLLLGVVRSREPHDRKQAQQANSV